MGKKISQLNRNELPYEGNELVAIVETAETRGGTLSSFMNYLSGAKYGTAQDSPIATPLANNFFQATQSVAGDLSASGKLVIGTSTVVGTLASIAGGTVVKVILLAQIVHMLAAVSQMQLVVYAPL